MEAVEVTSSEGTTTADSGADIIERRDVSCQHIRGGKKKEGETKKTNTKKRLAEKRVKTCVLLRRSMDPDGEWREIRKERVGVQKRIIVPTLFIWFAMFGCLFGCHRP